MLVTSLELFAKARRDNFAIPATNFFDLDSARVYVETAEELNKPLILAYAQSHEEMISLEEAALIGKYLSNKVQVPIVLHLDHGKDIATIKKAVDLGFTSVMIDASQDTIEENIRKTKEVVEYAHLQNVVVEAEIGHVGSAGSYEEKQSTDTIYTEVKDAVRFVNETGVDSLAISIGTAHGQYKGEPKINFELLEEMRDTIQIPLVLHGGSSSGDNRLNRCATSGISKINIFTDFIVAAFDEIQERQPKDYFQLKLIANQAMKDTLIHYYKVFETKEI